MIRIDVSTRVGNRIRSGCASTALADVDKSIEEELRKADTRVECIFFKGAGLAVNGALVNE